MAAPPEPREHDYAQEIAKVQTFRSRVEAAIDPQAGARRASRSEVLAGDGLEQAPFLEDVDDVGPAAKAILVGFGGGWRLGRESGGVGGARGGIERNESEGRGAGGEEEGGSSLEWGERGWVEGEEESASGCRCS